MLRRRYPAMLKWAGIFLVLMIVAGILGFVVDVAGWIAKLLFFVFLFGAVAAFAMKAMKRKAEGHEAKAPFGLRLPTGHRARRDD